MLVNKKNLGHADQTTCNAQIKTRNVSLSELDGIKPNNLIIFYWLGNDDIFLQSGSDIIEKVKEQTGEELTLSNAVAMGDNDMSGNTFELIVYDKEPYILRPTEWGFDER